MAQGADLAMALEEMAAGGMALPEASLPDVPELGDEESIDPEAHEEYQAQPLIQELQDDERALETVTSIEGLFNAYRSAPERQSQELIWNACTNAYKGVRPKNTPLGTYYNIREIFRQVETLKPQLNNQFFGGEALFKYKARFAEFEDQSAAGSAVVHDQIQRFHIERELRKWVSLGVKLGTGYLAYEWRKYQHFSMKISQLHAPQTEPVWERETTEMEQGAPGVEALSPRCVYVHPGVGDVRSSPAVFVTKTVSAADLKTLVREGWLDLTRTREAVEAGSSGSAERSSADGVGLGVERWGRVHSVLDGDEGYQLVVCYLSNGMEYAVLNDKHLVRAQMCPYGQIPMLNLRNYPQEDEHWGIPEPLLILADQELLNDFMALYVASVHWSYTPMWMMTNQVAKSWGNTAWKPGGKLVVGGPNEFNEIKSLTAEMRPTAMDLAQQAPFILGNMKLATGVTDELSGAGSGQKTATGVVRMQEAAGIRMQDKVREWMPEFSDLYKAFYNLNAMYLDEEWAVRVAGEDGRDVFKRYSPDNFEADVDVQVELANVMETGPEAANNMRTLFPLLNQHPLIEQTWLIKKLLKAHGERKPQQGLANSMTQSRDAVGENRQALAVGYLAEPKAGDDHLMHLEIHTNFMATPAFQQLAAQKPVWAYALESHAAIHQAYVEAQQKAQAQAAQTSQQPAGPGSPVPEADQRTEMMFDNAATGAAQQGMV